MTDDQNKPPTSKRHPLGGAFAFTLGTLLLTFTFLSAVTSGRSPGVERATMFVETGAKLVRKSIAAQALGRPSKQSKATAASLDILDRSVSDLEAEEEKLATTTPGFRFAWLALTAAWLIALGGRLYRGERY